MRRKFEHPFLEYQNARQIIYYYC